MASLSWIVLLAVFGLGVLGAWGLVLTLISAAMAS
ncbi:MAG: hypothetical protein RLZZ127_3133 [Planctomycetota bacterium]|jgi:hypothetical protein